MRRNLYFVCLISIFFVACKKNSGNSTTQPDAYMNLNATSAWNYQRTNSGVVTNYTITSTSRDTSINARTYHVYTNSTGGFQYYNISGHDYYQFDSLPAPISSGIIERLYLKDDAALSATWSQSLTVPVPGLAGFSIPVTITNTIAEKGIAHTVNSIDYSDVIHVSTTITSSAIPTGLTSNIHSYFARKYGLIENTTVIHLNYLGIVQDVNLQTKLLSATLH